MTLVLNLATMSRLLKIVAAGESVFAARFESEVDL
jgi:hypothetical protein